MKFLNRLKIEKLNLNKNHRSPQLKKNPKRGNQEIRGNK